MSRFSLWTVLFACFTALVAGLATPATAGPAADQWKATFGEWKTLLGELRQLRTRYESAEDDEIPALQTEYDGLVAKGQDLLERLRADGLAAYQEAPNDDRELARFLVKLADDDLKHDRYEKAAELTGVLVENGCEEGDIYNAAGIAAFVANDFEKAREYFAKAEEAGTLAGKGLEFQGLVDTYADYWAKEQELRKAEAEADDLPRVKLTTTKGDIVLELFENEAPQTVGNFVSLVEKGFYDGLTFHRVLPGFMAQGGCPKGDGTGGPGYNIYCECNRDDARMHFRGSLSMAHSGRPNTGGSQFFITFLPTPSLNKQHTVFGRVVEGMEVLEKIQRRDPQAASPPEPDRIIKAEVLRKRPDHEYVPTKVQ